MENQAEYHTSFIAASPESKLYTEVEVVLMIRRAIIAYHIELLNGLSAKIADFDFEKWFKENKK